MARTDKDSWDLATSVGATATMIAAQRALAAAGPDPLIHDPYAAPLVRAVGMDAYTRLAEGTVDVPAGSDFNPQRMAQGMAVRTRFFDAHFLDATRDGVGQAVILAAGLDSRAYRLPWPAGTVVYEIDLPDVIDFKTETLRGLGAEPTAQRRTVKIDLRDDWPAALRDAGFDPAAPSVWSAEGLVVYLPSEAQDALLDNITALSAPGSRFACEFIQDTSVFDTPAWRTRQERMGRLGFTVDIGELVYHGERNDVVDYLTAAGWSVSERTVLELHGANGFPYSDDEVAQAFAGMTYLSATLR
ncbi:class I SAM-dependent methyltransferase [Mycobacterium sp. M1]|uniref:S-adenosyl-L-methionine-dependent methyltransferase n=1 Tax=Mycolicibacter acidiphilus TaxID=2835306 RepID=A0ABS5RDP8_9MYCO|nr:class I SAM-dependent methyltransferase [Mycolicibacter acidiphilus]MBS9532406.1 class I SAM-dependent methyltransferase [Mycolicibacter acidiphilus]